MASQGGGDVTAVVTPSGHSGRSESASSERLGRVSFRLYLTALLTYYTSYYGKIDKGPVMKRQRG